jgi:GT2 family glycosyltransferase
VGWNGRLEHLRMNRVSIVLVNWNNWHDTVECLDSLMLLDYPDFRIVICDNGSRDDSLFEMKKWAKKRLVNFIEYSRSEAESGGLLALDPVLTLIRNEENLGFAGGNNVGLRFEVARGIADFFWILNNDTVVEPDALTQLVQRFQQIPRVGICGSTILLYHDRNRIQALGGGHYCSWIGLPWHSGRFSMRRSDVESNKAEASMNYVEGASMLVSRQFVNEIGFLCEDYFLYFEEADWAVRAKGRFELGYASRSIVYHKVGGSIGTSSNPAKKSYICDFFNIRNRLLFTRRFYPEALPTVGLVIFGELILRLILGKWDRAMMIFQLLCGRVERPQDILFEYRSKS